MLQQTNPRGRSIDHNAVNSLRAIRKDRELIEAKDPADRTEFDDAALRYLEARKNWIVSKI